MDSRGGCCIARYGGGGGGAGGGGYNMSTIDRIMLRFRPIAPKPANSGSTSPEVTEASPKSSRGKRRVTNGNSKRCNNNNNRKRKVSPEEKGVTTLPLLPETPDLLSPKESKTTPTWLSFGTSENNNGVTSFGRSLSSVDYYQQQQQPQIMRVVIGSCVTVECVTDTWVDEDGLGYTDEEKRINLERDTCPGFVSDGFGRVTWTNEAYKKMVVEQGVLAGHEIVVWLVMKDKVTVTETVGNNNKRAFTCRVRVQNQSTCKERRSITVPCDVWRLDSGGFAWRLDVKAALSLGW